MGLLDKIFRRDEYSVSLDKARCKVLYREKGRRLVVAGEAMADGYAVYTSGITEWDSPAAEAIDDAERQRIAGNIRRHFVERGKNVYLS